jgi:hypothetical protein
MVELYKKPSAAFTIIDHIRNGQSAGRSSAALRAVAGADRS